MNDWGYECHNCGRVGGPQEELQDCSEFQGLLKAKQEVRDRPRGCTLLGLFLWFPSSFPRFLKEFDTSLLATKLKMVGFSIQPYGIQGMLKEGHRHLSGLDEAVLKNIDACKQLSTITRTSLGPNGKDLLTVVIFFSLNELFNLVCLLRLWLVTLDK